MKKKRTRPSEAEHPKHSRLPRPERGEDDDYTDAYPLPITQTELAAFIGVVEIEPLIHCIKHCIKEDLLARLRAGAAVEAGPLKAHFLQFSDCVNDRLDRAEAKKLSQRARSRIRIPPEFMVEG